MSQNANGKTDVEDKKKAVLASAEHLFATKGFIETKVADIAAESGLHEASIYSYYKNKKNILFAIYGSYLQTAIRTLKEHFLGMKEPGPKFRKAIWHYLADMKSNPNYARILMMAQRENPEFYGSEYFQYLKGYVRLVLDVITAGQKERFFRQDISPRLIRNLAMGASVFTVFDSIVHNTDYDPHEHSDLIYELVLNATAFDTSTNEEKKGNFRKNRAKFRKSQIIKSAMEVFSSKGYLNTTISEIANHADLGDATLYEYFENKEAILLSIPEVYLKDLVSDGDIIFKDLPDTEKNLRKLIWRWIWILYTNEHFSRLLVLELLRNIHFYSSPAYTYYEAFLKKIRETVQKGQDEGIFIKDIPLPTYLHMVVGTIDQFLLPQFLMNRPPPGIAELGDIVDCLVRAIKVQESF